MTLRWVEDRGPATRRSQTYRIRGTYLYVGTLPDPVATLVLCNGGKWYRAWVELPGRDVSREVGPLDEMKALVFAHVQEWFARAALIDEGYADGAGI